MGRTCLSWRSLLGKRSARSIATGPGSRGGHWHEPEFRRAYYRAWRATHPEYRERNARRCAERRHRAQLEIDRREVEVEVARLTPIHSASRRFKEAA